MSPVQVTDVSTKSNAAAWAGVVATFGAASLVQILAYGSAILGDIVEATTAAASSWLSELLYFVIVLAWLLGPAAIATWFSARKLQFWKGAGTARMTVARAFAMIILPALSIYLGVFVSFNTWGT